MVNDPNVYGYVNGQPVYSAEEFRYKKRGFGEITSDAELMKYAEKVTGNWSRAGHNHKFVSFYLSDYALDEPYASLTKKEFERLKKLQKIAKDEYDTEQAKYNFKLYEGRPLSESEIRMFLDKMVNDTIEQWKDGFYVDQATNYRDKLLADYKNGKVIPVSTYGYNAAYGNGTGAYDRTLYSDGSIKDGCYGYLD